MKIPAQNIYHILCYAWNDKILADYAISGEIETNDSLDHFCLEVLKFTIPKIIKSGVHKEYIEEIYLSKTIKGKLDIKRSLNEFNKRTCSVYIQHDNYIEDNEANRLIKLTLSKLSRSENLSKSKKSEIFKLLNHFRLVGDSNKFDFKKAQSCLSKHKRKEYRLALSISILFHKTLIYSSKFSGSKYSIIEALSDRLTDSESGSLFEKFLKNFLASHLDSKVSSNNLSFNSHGKSSNFSNLLPQMSTDICVTTPEDHLIIEAKCNNTVFQTQSEYNEKFKSNHLYQLQSYLLHTKKDQHIKGLLFYCHSHDVFEQGWILNYPITIATINLSSDWKGIKESILGIVERAICHTHQENQVAS